MARQVLSFIGCAVSLFGVLMCAGFSAATEATGGMAAFQTIKEPAFLDEHGAVTFRRLGMKQPAFLDERGEVTFRRLASNVGLAPNLSPQCSRGIQQYKNCQVINAAFFACSIKAFLEEPAVQLMLNCSKVTPPEKRLDACRLSCLLQAAKVLDEPTPITGACNSTIQAMQSFSAKINFFEVGQIDEEKNFTDPMLIPMPNVKGLGSISVLDLGKPAKCAQIPGAQYCLLTGLIQTPLGMPITFQLGYCLPDMCDQSEITSILHSVGGNITDALHLSLQCGFVEPLGEAEGISKQVQDVLGWGGIPVYYPFSQPVTTGFVVTILFVIMFALLVCAGTTVDWRRESQQREIESAFPTEAGSLAGRGLEAAQPLTEERPQLPPMTTLQTFLNHWSALRNGRSFLRTRTGKNNPFACMDAIRTLSMAQVILGHMYVYSISSNGMLNMEQFNPPRGMMGQLWFMIVPGCFYGVDSFFMLSGFLCCYSMQKKVFNNPRNRSLAGFCILLPKFILLRVLRLLPLEMLCIALCVNVLPLAGTGILWNAERPDGQHCFDAAGGAGCEKYWWTNLLFIQDLDQFVGKCFGHTWYLANDMQLYLTAPFFTLAYSYSKKAGWALLFAGLLVGILSPMVIAASLNIVPDTLLGGSDYMPKIYMKPYCRCTPFFVGIGAAWLWQEKLEQFNFRHVTMKGRLISYGLSCLGVFLCLATTFGRVVFYQCDLVTCSNLDTNPGGKFLLFFWAGFSILGWSLGLAIIMILCFQNRFLPVVQNFLNLPGWQPFAKLSYACYLCHTSVLIMNYCQQEGPASYNNAIFFFYYIAFVAVTMCAAFCLHLLLEKPLANLQMKVFAVGGE